jgi:hypothetical protein
VVTLDQQETILTGPLGKINLHKLHEVSHLAGIVRNDPWEDRILHKIVV